MYLIIAILVLGFLIFIHELGHYWMARRVGMRVEAFGIGFGRAIYKWERDGVEWRLNWIPFGGYVRIKGQDTEDENMDPYLVKDGFFGRPPIDRIKVSLAGPFANLILAFLVFGLLWLVGGRDKSFGEFSNKIGWIDRDSDLYKAGIRPGDEVTAYTDRPFNNNKDHVYAALTADQVLRIRGEHFNYFEGSHVPFEYTVKVYPHPRVFDKSFKTAGILDSSTYIIYKPTTPKEGEEETLDEKLAKGSPLIESGIQPNDRLIWANGELIFSTPELSYLINEPRTLVTVERGGTKLLRRIPRIPIQELRVDPAFREEIVDWQYEAGLQKLKTSKLFVIPYNLNHGGGVENLIAFIDPEAHKIAFPEYPYSEMEEPLKAGDKIVAVNGEPVQYSHQIISRLQEPKAILIVLRGTDVDTPQNWEVANQDYFKDVNFKELEQLIADIGSATPKMTIGKLNRLHTVTPKTHAEFATSSEIQAAYNTQKREEWKQYEAIEDPEKRSHMLELLSKTEQQLYLGPPAFADAQVLYNPGPVALFGDVVDEIWRTLKAFATGTLSPKWIAGPIGLVAVIQSNWAHSVKEGIYWLGAVSLNLGFLNLLPIPVLDGGSIVFSLFELITRRRVKIKTLEKVVIPFAFLLVIFFLFLTFNDVSRLITTLFG